MRHSPNHVRSKGNPYNTLQPIQASPQQRYINRKTHEPQLAQTNTLQADTTHLDLRIASIKETVCAAEIAPSLPVNTRNLVKENRQDDDR